MDRSKRMRVLLTEGNFIIGDIGVRDLVKDREYKDLGSSWIPTVSLSYSIER